MSMQNMPLLLTAEETAQILRTTRLAVYAMIERDQLPGVTRIGRRVLIRSQALMQWLDEKSGSTTVAIAVSQTSRRRQIRR